MTWELFRPEGGEQEVGWGWGLVSWQRSPGGGGADAGNRPSALLGQDLSYTRMDTEKGFLRQMNNWAEGGRRQAVSLSEAVTVEKGTLSSSLLIQVQRWVDTSVIVFSCLAQTQFHKPIAGLLPSLPGALMLLLSTADSAHVLHR